MLTCRQFICSNTPPLSFEEAKEQVLVKYSSLEGSKEEKDTLTLLEAAIVSDEGKAMLEKFADDTENNSVVAINEAFEVFLSGSADVYYYIMALKGLYPKDKVHLFLPPQNLTELLVRSTFQKDSNDLQPSKNDK